MVACGDDDSSRASDPNGDAGIKSENGVDASAPGAITPRDASASDAAAGDSGQVPDAGLPACDLACDRVVDCMVTDCAALGYKRAGTANQACLQVCDAAWAGTVLAHDACGDVVGAGAERSVELKSLCEVPLCDTACERYASCAIAECSALGDESRGELLVGCADFCKEDEADGLLQASCSDLIGALKMEPAFANICELGTGCSDAPGCIAYAEKVTGCIVSSCEPQADGFRIGLNELLFAACMDPEDCTQVGSVAYLTAESTTCESEGLVALASHPTFTGFCDPDDGAEEWVLRGACDAVSACPFYVEFGSTERCVATLAIGENAAVLASCLTATTDCSEQAQCF